MLAIVDGVSAVLGILTIDGAAEATACSKDLEDGSLKGLGVGARPHSAGNGVNIIPRDVTIVGDVLNLNKERRRQNRRCAIDFLADISTDPTLLATTSHGTFQWQLLVICLPPFLTKKPQHHRPGKSYLYTISTDIDITREQPSSHTRITSDRGMTSAGVVIQRILCI